MTMHGTSVVYVGRGHLRCFRTGDMCLHAWDICGVSIRGTSVVFSYGGHLWHGFRTGDICGVSIRETSVVFPYVGTSVVFPYGRHLWHGFRTGDIRGLSIRGTSVARFPYLGHLWCFDAEDV